MIGPRHRLNRNTKPLRATGVQSSNSPIPSSPPLIHNRRYRQFRRTLGSRSLNSSSQAPKSRGKDLARARRGRHWPPDRHCRERLRRERERIETKGIETRTGSSHLCFRSARGDASVAMGMEPIGPAAVAAPVGLTLCYNCPEGTAEAGCRGDAAACAGGAVRVLHGVAGAGSSWLAVAAAMEGGGGGGARFLAAVGLVLCWCRYRSPFRLGLDVVLVPFDSVPSLH
jgi:hypothetical protein